MYDSMSVAIREFREALIDAELKAADKDYNAQDAKFVRVMIVHHQAAVEMADKQVSKGKNEEVVKIAKEIAAAQKVEISQMKKWLKDRSLSESGDGMGM
ncbi:MAG: DUF305 domain-containing protein [Pseudomonadota bacterium]